MATVTRHHRSIDLTFGHPRARLWAIPLGRFLFSLIFVLSGMNHFNADTIAYATNSGVPMANLLVPLSGLLAIVGGLSVMLGYFARVGALLLILFLVPVTLSMHAFWAIPDPQAAQMQMINFMKNLSMLGGALLLAFYGAGPISIDSKKPRI